MSGMWGARILRAVGLGAAALAVGSAATTPGGGRLDAEMFRAVNDMAGAKADRFFSTITELGSLWASGAAALALAAHGRPRPATKAIAAACVTWITTQALKRAFDRPRPYEADTDAHRMIARPPASSWPSSHPAVLLTFVTVAGRELGLRPGPRAALTGLAGLVAFSRVYVGVHYPADVAGGLLIGRAVADAASA